MNKIEKLFEDKIQKIFKERLKNQLISNIKINKIDSFIGYRSANGFEELNEPKKPISCAELLFKISFKWKGFLDNYLKKSIIQSTFNSITLETSARNSRTRQRTWWEGLRNGQGSFWRTILWPLFLQC